MNKCPICGQEVGVYHEVTFLEPFVHNHPFDGLMIYGAFSAPKETICFENNYLHFAFYDAENNLGDHRLVRLGVENPATKSPSEEFADNEGEVEYDDDDYWDDDDEVYYPGEEFDYDDEEFPHGSLDY
jgi:hypothetical protein